MQVQKTTSSEEVEQRSEANMIGDCPFRTRPVIKYLGRFITPELVSCPTCGRAGLMDECGTQPFIDMVNQVDEHLRKMGRPLKVAVMGCVVNGPGEAKDADVGIALARNKAILFRHGELLRSVPLERAIPELLEEVQRTW